MVLVDTPVWSDYLRGPTPDFRVAEILENLINERRALLIGPVRQEILSGVRHKSQFAKLKLLMRGFPEQEILTSDYERAAEMSNHCRSAGVQGAATDLLICAVSVRLRSSVFTLDKDFKRYAGLLPIRLFGTESSL